MDNAIYTTLTRQSGLLREMQVVANNIANMSTTGYRREGRDLLRISSRDAGRASRRCRWPRARARDLDLSQGALDPDRRALRPRHRGRRVLPGRDARRASALTRAGQLHAHRRRASWSRPTGIACSMPAARPVFVPPDAATIALAHDGTLSADGQPLTQIGLWQPVDPHRPDPRAGRRAVRRRRRRRAAAKAADSCRAFSKDRTSIRSPRSPG